MAKTPTRGGAASAPSVDAALAKQLLTDMVLIRRFEEKAAEAYTLGKIGGFLHLYIGEEAVAVGATSALRPDDYAISAYREHGHCLAKGADPKRTMAELYGRRDGLSARTCRSRRASASPSSIREATRSSSATSATVPCRRGNFTSR